MRRLGMGMVGATMVLLLAVVLAASVVLAGVNGRANAAPGTGGSAGLPSAGQPAVPTSWELLDQAAAGSCPGLSWSVLAAVGRLATDSGRDGAPWIDAGVSGSGAEGPMGLSAATFAADATVGPGGMEPASPYDPTDAVATAARALCADGAGSPGGLGAAVGDLEGSPALVEEVLVLSASLADDPSLASAAASALTFAAAQLGVPYLWGGTGVGGFDCSGLTQAAYRSAGVALPRVAQDQFDAGPPVPADVPLVPGDLVFFGGATSDIGHVGLVVSVDGARAVMIDAPHTGADVRLDALPSTPGAAWGGERFVGATAPGT